MNLSLPKSFNRTRHSPTLKELNFIYDWLKHNMREGCSALEFGAGPTTWAIATALNPNKYVVVEDYIPSIQAILDHLTDITIIKGIWYNIPEDIKYDFVFVDSSAGYPPRDGGLHRDEAVKYAQRLISDNGVIAIHDWHTRSGKAPRKYLESCSNYKLVASLNDRTGVGIYKKCI
jgi:hypothetical protein